MCQGLEEENLMLFLALPLDVVTAEFKMNNENNCTYGVTPVVSPVVHAAGEEDRHESVKVSRAEVRPGQGGVPHQRLERKPDMQEEGGYLAKVLRGFLVQQVLQAIVYQRREGDDVSAVFYLHEDVKASQEESLVRRH